MTETSGSPQRGPRLPCFLVRPGLTILPAFGSFTGVRSVVPEAADQVFVVADGEVLPILRKADA